jgi:hypothetical protein
MANTPPWATLGDATQIVMILSASHQPRWPSEVQGLSLMFSPKTSPMCTNLKFTGQFLKPFSSQRCISQIQKEVQFTTKYKYLYLYQLSIFLELKSHSLRYETASKK